MFAPAHENISQTGLTSHAGLENIQIVSKHDEKLKKCEMKEGWMKNDEGWGLNDEGSLFQAVEGFWGLTNRQTNGHLWM